MYKYCSQDVTILRLCCLKFRDLFMSETRVDPFCYCTIAASVMAIYRSKYLKNNTIGIIPKNMYRKGNKPYSKSSIEWLEFIAAQTNSKIQHSCNGVEKVIVDDVLGKVYYVMVFVKTQIRCTSFMVVFITLVVCVFMAIMITLFTMNVRWLKCTRRQLNENKDCVS